MIIFHLMLVRPHQKLGSCPFSRWGSWGSQSTLPKVNLGVQSTAINHPWAAGRVGSKRPTVYPQIKLSFSGFPPK